MAPIVLAVMAAGWTALLAAAPQLPIPLAAFVYVFGSVICHQIPERSFYVADAQVPVCARCLGIYGGLAIGAFATTMGRFVRGSDPLSRSVPGSDPRLPGLSRLALVLGAAPTALMVPLEWIGVWPASNPMRAAAGVALGMAAGWVLIRTVTLHYEGCAPRPPIGSNLRTPI